MLNTCEGNTSSAEAPCAAAMRAIRAALWLPSAQTPLITGSLSPISSSVRSRMRCCSSNVQACTSEAWPFTVIADSPRVAATSRRWRRVPRSSMLKSSCNASSVAGITPCGM